MIKVSIIVPVYNVADYLRRCLDSCVNQTLQEIEIVVVNDCSPDPRDGEIMEEYEKRFPNKVRCIWHEKNLLQGCARNTGIRQARADLIYCADSDDYIDLNLCEKMYNAIIAEKADMAVCDFYRVEKNHVIKNWMPNGKFATSDLYERMKDLKLHSPCNIMIKKLVIENNDLYFPPHNGYEDVIVSLWYLTSKKIVRVNEALYYYCIRDNSTVQSQKIESYFLSIQTIEYILISEHFNKLDSIVKKILFLYLMKNILSVCYIVCVKYATEFVKFCNNIIEIFKIYKVDYNDDIYMQSEENIFYKRIFRFIEQNINNVDFNLEFAAYYEYQQSLMYIKKMHRLISPYANKRLTLWGAEESGKWNATCFSILGIKFEITDENAKLHGKKVLANIAIKAWNEAMDNTDVVFVTEAGFFDDVHERLARECPNIEVVDLTRLLGLY